MKRKIGFVAILVVLLFTLSCIVSVRADQNEGKQTEFKGGGKSPGMSSLGDLEIITVPPLPGFNGGKNPDHMQRIKIIITSLNGISIDRAQFLFDVSGWDSAVVQNGMLYMNSSTDMVPSTVWYIELGISYFYREPWPPKEIQEDAYDTVLLVTAGTTVKWSIKCFCSTRNPPEIESPEFNYTVEGAWYRTGKTDSEIFKNNVDIIFSPQEPMLDQNVQITMNVKQPPPGRTIKPKIYVSRIHVSFQFFDSNQKDIQDMQLDGEPAQPELTYVKYVTIVKAWHYKPGIVVTFWCEAWQEESKRFFHILSYPTVWCYKVNESGLWKYPPPKGTFDQNLLISVVPNVIQNPHAAELLETGGCRNVTVIVESRFPDVPLYPARIDPTNPFRIIRGTMLWYTVLYEDRTGTVSQNSTPVWYPVLPKEISQTKMTMTIPPDKSPNIPSRFSPGEVKFYIEAWNMTRQTAGVLYSDAHPSSPDTVGSDDPFVYDISKLSQPTQDMTSFIVWVYDERFESKYIPGVEVVFKNGTNLDIPISQTETNAMGWCFPVKPGGSEPLPLRIGDTILVEVNYQMQCGISDSKKQLIKASHLYKIELSKGYGNVTILKEYALPSDLKNRILYYVVESLIPNVTANILFKFNWIPPEKYVSYAEVQPFDREALATGAGTIIGVIILVPSALMLDRRRKKMEDDEKRVTL